MSERLPRQRSAQSLSAEAERLYRAHSADLEVFLLGVLRDRNLVEDVLQQTFRKLQEFLMRTQASEESLGEQERGNSADEFSAGWLFRVAYNEAMQVRRRQNLEGAAYGRSGLVSQWITARDQRPIDHGRNDSSGATSPGGTSPGVADHRRTANRTRDEVSGNRRGAATAAWDRPGKNGRKP